MKTYVFYKARGGRTIRYCELGERISPAFEVFAVHKGTTPGMAYADWYRKTHPYVTVLSVGVNTKTRTIEVRT